MTTLAPLPGRGDTGPDGDVTVDDGTPVDDVTVDLTVQHARPSTNDPAAQAAWLMGLALELLSEKVAEPEALAEVVAAAAGRPRPLEGAYGRAVALLSEYPGDPLVHRTVDLLAKALLRSRRPARAEEA